MASLYDAIRKPWAAWEMTMEGHDPANNRCLDLSGNGRHLTIGNGAGSNEPTKLVQRRGYHATRNNQYLKRASQAWSSGVITLEAFISAQDEVGTYFLSFGSSSSNIVCALSTVPTGIFFFTGSRINIGFAARTFVGCPFGGTHIAGRYDGATTDIFVNGVYVDSATTPTAPASGTHTINVFEAESGGGDITGNMYLCRIWDVALTDIQIQELARRAKRELHRI